MSSPLDRAPDSQEQLRDSLIDHMRTFPQVLPKALREAAQAGGITLNNGDFSLRMRPTHDLFFESICVHDFKGTQVIFLSTPSVRFAYDPETGNEIGNTMMRYDVTDRTSLLPHWSSLLCSDSGSLRSRGLPQLAQVQDHFIGKITDQLPTDPSETRAN